ncbi:MAG: hypothetical protein IKN43_11115 [Selenomonadaceae bacterium]|nr:hypothetical protein [Selenomonadaceae bacterium]
MHRKVLCFFIICAIVFMFSSCSLSYSCEGFENWFASLATFASLTNKRFLEKDFLTDYPYKDGSFNYDLYHPSLFSKVVERSFIWLSYDDEETYQHAKQSRFDNRIDTIESFDGTEAFGFSFFMNYYSYDDSEKPNKEDLFSIQFTAFGFNDETQTLVFIGFGCDQPQKEPKNELAKTDFPAFLTHYYSEWFDWDAGVGYTASEANAD